jgi:hypothetical protein
MYPIFIYDNPPQIMDNPLPQVDTWILNETYFNEASRIGYKKNDSKILGPPCFRMTFNTNQQRRISV